MRSILPEALEQRRIAVAKSHNRAVLLLLVSVLSVLALLGLILPRAVSRGQIPWSLGVLAIPIVLLEFYAARRIVQRDDQHAEQLGFLCPHCGRSLYEARSLLHLTGQCPKCGESIVKGSSSKR